MSYNKLLELIDDKPRLKSVILNFSSGNIASPYIIEETLELLDSDNVFFNIISDSNKIALCNMIDKYFNSCWDLYIEDMKLDALLKFGKIETYKIEASNGIRYATTGEVAQGVRGLIGEYLYVAGEENYKKLCLLEWTFNGKPYHFRQAGYNLSYSEDRQVTTTFYEMVQLSAVDLNELFAWVKDNDEFKQTIKKITKMKKNKGYKYASFEPDEITEDITIKQLVYNIQKVFPRSSPNKEYRRALALALAVYKDKKILSPLEISFLRDIYEKHALDTQSRNGRNTAKQRNETLKKQCELLLKERYSGKIDTNHFAYTIIRTLKTNNYTGCSIKQYNIIKEALSKLGVNPDNIYENVESPTEQNTSEVVSEDEIDNTLQSISDAIGNGLFEDEE